jgi:uncharacterized protein (DUF1330 family)
MSYYFIAHIKINDMEEYQKYLDKARDVFKKYNGKYISLDNEPEILEGSWDYTKVVLIRFDKKTDFYDWYNSAEYQEILKFRLEAAHCDSILAKGI